jgi:hypothetical protein
MLMGWNCHQARHHSTQLEHVTDYELQSYNYFNDGFATGIRFFFCAS